MDWNYYAVTFLHHATQSLRTVTVRAVSIRDAGYLAEHGAKRTNGKPLCGDGETVHSITLEERQPA